MNTTDYNELNLSNREYQRESRARAEVLSTIDELHQYLNGNVTIEAAADAARELTYRLNELW